MKSDEFWAIMEQLFGKKLPRGKITSWSRTKRPIRIKDFL